MYLSISTRIYGIIDYTLNNLLGHARKISQNEMIENVFLFLKDYSPRSTLSPFSILSNENINLKEMCISKHFMTHMSL